MTTSPPATGQVALGTTLSALTERVREILLSHEGQDAPGFQRSLATLLFEEIHRSRALSLVIPREYGGVGASPLELLSLLEAVSYESLPLGLVFGINIALFLQPLAKFGAEAIKRSVFSRFTDQGALGGLMLTEPGFGTDLLSMRTSWRRRGEEYEIKGEKHWAGLSGMADFWLMSARESREKGGLKRDIDFFVCDSRESGQEVMLEESFPSLGLLMIPYGRNRVDLSIPLGQRLVAPGSGVRLLLDLLHRSRMSFGGMAAGFLRRVLDDALARCRGRSVGGRSLRSYDQVERRLAEIQAAHTVASALCADASGRIGLERDLSGEGLRANIHKALLTDLMQQSAQSFLQLSGGDGYRLDRRAGQAVVDSRPFQIFEGSNDVLYDQVASSFLAPMKAGKESSLARFLSMHELTRRAAGRFARLLDFSPGDEPSQRRRVDLGRILARVAAADLLEALGAAGYAAALVSNAIEFLRSEVAGLAALVPGAGPIRVVEDLPGPASWQDCAT